MVWAETSPNGLANFSKISVNKRMVRWLISSFTRGLMVVDSEIGMLVSNFRLFLLSHFGCKTREIPISGIRAKS